MCHLLVFALHFVYNGKLGTALKIPPLAVHILHICSISKPEIVLQIIKTFHSLRCHPKFRLVCCSSGSGLVQFWLRSGRSVCTGFMWAVMCSCKTHRAVLWQWTSITNITHTHTHTQPQLWGQIGTRDAPIPLLYKPIRVRVFLFVYLPIPSTDTDTS